VAGAAREVDEQREGLVAPVVLGDAEHVGAPAELARRHRPQAHSRGLGRRALLEEGTFGPVGLLLAPPPRGTARASSPRGRGCAGPRPRAERRGSPVEAAAGGAARGASAPGGERLRPSRKGAPRRAGRERGARRSAAIPRAPPRARRATRPRRRSARRGAAPRARRRAAPGSPGPAGCSGRRARDARALPAPGRTRGAPRRARRVSGPARAGSARRPRPPRPPRETRGRAGRTPSTPSRPRPAPPAGPRSPASPEAAPRATRDPPARDRGAAPARRTRWPRPSPPAGGSASPGTPRGPPSRDHRSRAAAPRTRAASRTPRRKRPAIRRGRAPGWSTSPASSSRRGLHGWSAPAARGRRAGPPDATRSEGAWAPRDWGPPFPPPRKPCAGRAPRRERASTAAGFPLFSPA
jgi:hypothetical protein